MYTHTHTRIRNYVMVGADLPPPGYNRVKARAFSCQWRDTISIMLVVSSPRWIIAKITLICFRFTGNKTRMAAVKLITSTPVSIDIPGSPPPLSQWLRPKDIKSHLDKIRLFHSVAAWLMCWRIRKYIAQCTVSKETPYYCWKKSLKKVKVKTKIC